MRHNLTLAIKYFQMKRAPVATWKLALAFLPDRIPAKRYGYLEISAARADFDPHVPALAHHVRCHLDRLYMRVGQQLRDHLLSCQLAVGMTKESDNGQLYWTWAGMHISHWPHQFPRQFPERLGEGRNQLPSHRAFVARRLFGGN